MITLIGFGIIIFLLMLKGMADIAIYFAIACAIILILPIDGFKKDDVIIYLEPLRREGNIEKKYYIELWGTLVWYAYDNKAAYGIYGLAYEEERICANIKIYTDPNCQAPYLKKMITKPIRFYCTFAPFWKKIEYVFYIPEDAIYDKSKEVKRKNEMEPRITIERD